jgi:hypothetical protein
VISLGTGSCGESLAFEAASGHFYRSEGCYLNSLDDINPSGWTSSSVSTSINAYYSRALTSWSAGWLVHGDSSGRLHAMKTDGTGFLIRGSGPGYKGLAVVPAGIIPTSTPTPTALATPAGKMLLAAGATAPNLYQVNPLDGSFGLSYPVNVPGKVLTVLTGIALDPISNLVYLLARYQGENSSDRHLLSFDPATGVVAEIGVTTRYFSGLAFDNFGQLYGVAGNGDINSGQLFSIDKATGVETLFSSTSIGANGLGVAFNPLDSLIYRIEGNNSPGFDSVDLTGTTEVNVGTSGATNMNDQATGLAYYQAGQFHAAFGKDLYQISSTGAMYKIATMPADVKGFAWVSVTSLPTPSPTATYTQPPAFTSTPTQTRITASPIRTARSWARCPRPRTSRSASTSRPSPSRRSGRSTMWPAPRWRT